MIRMLAQSACTLAVLGYTACVLRMSLYGAWAERPFLLLLFVGEAAKLLFVSAAMDQRYLLEPILLLLKTASALETFWLLVRYRLPSAEIRWALILFAAFAGAGVALTLGLHPDWTSIAVYRAARQHWHTTLAVAAISAALYLWRYPVAFSRRDLTHGWFMLAYLAAWMLIGFTVPRTGTAYYAWSLAFWSAMAVLLFCWARAFERRDARL